MSLKGKKVAILAGPDYEDLELHYPRIRLIEAGAEVTVLASTKEPLKGKKGLPVQPDMTFEEAEPVRFDAVVIPGGWAPDRVRRDPREVSLVKRLDDEGKIVASICHGAQVLISAKTLKGRRLTCVSAIKDDVVNAGADYVDSAVVRDRNLITSRVPDDLPDFCREIINALASQ